MSDLEKHVERVIDLAERINATSDNLDSLHGIDKEFGISYFDNEVRDRMKERNIPEEVLEKFLENLPKRTVLEIRAIMYVGRGDGTFLEMRDHLQGDDHEANILSIVEKHISLPMYLRKGLESMGAT